nr:hypothetical protein [Tanacetum cinerariifolium]
LELFPRHHNDVQNIHEELPVYINIPSWDRLTVCYYDDDEEDYAIAVTPSLPTEEPDNSLSLGDEHLDTILATKSNKFIKSSVENRVPIPSESDGVPDNMCDVPFHDNSPPLDVSKYQFEDFSDSNDESTSINDDSFSIDNIEYVEASPLNFELVSSEVMEIVILKVGGIEDDILLIKDDILLTPSLPTEEPDNSLSLGDEHLDTILATKSNKFIKSSVENRVPIPSESDGVPDNMCDVPFHDNSPPLDVSKYQFEDFSDSNDESTSINDDSFSIDNIEYVEASPLNFELVSSEVMEIVILKVGGIEDDILLIKDDILRKKLLNVNLLIANIEALNDHPAPSSNFMTKSSFTSLNSLLEDTNAFDNSLPEFGTFCFDLEKISSGSTTTRDISLPEYEAFYDDHVKEISSDSTTNHSDSSLYDSFIFDLSINPFPPADRSDFYEFTDDPSHIISPLKYDCFCFKNEPKSGDFTMDVVEDTFPTREPRVHNALTTHPTLQLNLDFILSSESLFAYVVWIFLYFLSYLVAPQYLISFGNKDTIFDLDICNYHISSFLPDVSHRSRTFIKLNILNESLMEISFSTCSPMDQ